MAFLASALALSITFIAAIVPPIDLGPGRPAPGELYPAPPGYLLPWAGGEIQAVTQGEETSFTHNGIAAYAFDFGLNYDVVVAARSGKVTMVRDDSNMGGCSAVYSTASNYVVIDHGDGTSALYLHLAHASALVRPGDIVDRGQPIAISGETGVTCNSTMTGPGPHLHFQVQQTVEHRYFTQSLPIAFDDINSNSGVPQHGRSYVSGNFGRGQPQKVKLTPHRVPRVFNPVAVPVNPGLVEADPAPVPTPTPTEEPQLEGNSSDTPATGSDGSPEPSETPPPQWTPAADDSATPASTVTATPKPSPTDPPPATPSPAPSEEPAEEPTETATAVAAEGGEPATPDDP